MKLLHCTKCNDLLQLYREPRPCACGACIGKTDPTGRFPECNGPYLLVGINNTEFLQLKAAFQEGHSLQTMPTYFFITECNADGCT